MHESFEEKMSAADALIDRAANQIQGAEPDPEAVEAAADRVWRKLSAPDNGRRGMRLVRGEASETETPADEASPRARRGAPKQDEPASTRWGLWALAAVLIVGLGVGYVLMNQLWTAGPAAVVQTVDGQLFRVESAAHVPLAVGDQVRGGEVIRSGRDGGAVVTLEDGSQVELAPRSELSIRDSHRGTTLDLARGNVIVEAAEQRSRHLYVSTDDCLVSVTGTIFSVNHGTKGSRVSVIEGEVRVDHGGREDVLHPGDQVTTHQLLAPLSVADEIAWSQNVDGYLQILREYTDLRRELEERVAPPGLRYSSRLLDLMPADTTLYVAAPNVAEAVTETHRIFQEQLSESPALEEWLDANANSFEGQLEEMIGAFGELGGFFGEEVAVGGQTAQGDMGALVLAEVVDPAGLRDFIERQVTEHGGSESDLPVFVDDPAAAADGQFSIWFHDGLAVGTLQGERMRQVAGFLAGESNPFVGGEFHDSLSGLYAEGAEFVIAVDLQNLVGGATIQAGEDGKLAARLETLGVDNARHLMFEQKTTGEKTHHLMAVSFDDARHGIASWLAEPAPMGGLEFVSPDAKLVFGVVFKDPAQLLDDLLAISGEVPSGLRSFEERYGLSLRDDVAASIGGEMVVAVDGPVLPKPAIKAIVEIYDPARFQWALEQGLAEANAQLAAEGKEPLTIEQSEVGGRTYYSLPSEMVDIHYTFVEGYLLLAGDRALIDQAIRYRESGYSITRSPKLAALMPQDGRNNFSALLYQDFSGIAKAVAEQLSSVGLTDEQKAALESINFEEPMLGYAYGEREQITVAAASDASFLQTLLLRAFGLKNPSGLEALFGHLTAGGDA